MFINTEQIERILANAKGATKAEIDEVLLKARQKKGLTPYEVAVLLQIEEEDQLKKMFQIAGEIKQSIYGNRVVIFAPLYVSNYCVNGCTYCGFQCKNKMGRKKLTREEVKREVEILEKMGHKRLALEAGEDPVNCTIDDVVDYIHAVYEAGDIRRINVNIAATTVDDYIKLKKAQIGTYILFQETYHQPTYEAVHPTGPKADFNYHLTAFNRAMLAGIDDVGAGVLFGLYDPKFEVLGLMFHQEHLEKNYGVGFHTVSFPRIQQAAGMTKEDYPYLVDDETFKKVVAVVRLAIPYTGIILSTRESAEMRNALLQSGVSQVSAGSSTDVGGYQEGEKSMAQFEVSDERTPIEVIKELIKDGFVPSYCTACYRQGRTGDRFMQLAKNGDIRHVCAPNALMTLMEYIVAYGDEQFRVDGEAFVLKELEKIENKEIREKVRLNLEMIKEGKRDLYL